MSSRPADPQVSPDAALPLMVHVRGQRCVVVGGGKVGAQRARRLAEHGAEILVVSPDLCDAMTTLVDDGLVAEVRARAYRSGDLEGCMLAVAATSDRGTNAEVADDARSGGILCNVADMPTDGNVTMPASAQRGLMTMVVATSGSSPVAASVARDRALDALGPGWEVALEQLSALRSTLISAYPDPNARRAAVERLLEPAVLESLASASDPATQASAVLGVSR